jgi:hypothetical protein
MANKGKRESVLDNKVKEMKASGTFKGVRDAKKRLKFVVTEAHVRIAKGDEESECVVAQALSEALPDEVINSIGECVSKVLHIESGWLDRYMTPANLRAAIRHFDKTFRETGRGVWNLPPGVYYLLPPTGNTRLVENQGEEGRDRLKKRWQNWEQKFEANGSSGTGKNGHRSRPIPPRQITIIRG